MAKTDPEAARRQRHKTIRWVVTVFLITVVISGIISLVSDEVMDSSSLPVAFLILLAIARALVNNPSTIIADEPTGNLDPERSFEIMALLQEINNLGTTMLVVTHDQNLAKLFHKRTIAINEGVVVRDGIGEESKHEAQ